MKTNPDMRMEVHAEICIRIHGILFLDSKHTTRSYDWSLLVLGVGPLTCDTVGQGSSACVRLKVEVIKRTDERHGHLLSVLVVGFRAKA